MSRISLLERVQGLLTRTYGLRAPLEPIGRYVIGDAGLALLYGGGEGRVVRSAEGSGAKLLLREDAGAMRACLYLPDALVARLERHSPERGLHDDNVDAFAVFVEEVDHLLVAAERAETGREVSLLELELHAEVSKYLVLARYLAGSRARMGAEARVWLRHRLFEGRTFVESDPAVRARYEHAARHAVRFLNALERVAPRERLPALRAFHRAPLDGKLAMGRG